MSVGTKEAGAEAGVNVASGNVSDLAQSFTLSIAGSISAVKLALLPLGTPAGTLTLKLEGDSGGGPDGTALDSATLSVASVTKEDSYTFTFSKRNTLEASKTYWLRLSASYGNSDSDLVQWLGASGASGQPGVGSGAYLSRGSNVWSKVFLASPLARVFLFKFDCTSATASPSPSPSP